MLSSILKEMVEYLLGSGIACRETEDGFEVTGHRRRWFSSRRYSERIQVATQPLENRGLPPLAEGTTVFLSLRLIPKELRRELDKQRVQWLEIERKERSDLSHELGEEVVQYLRRHGVRFNRPPPDIA